MVDELYLHCGRILAAITARKHPSSSTFVFLSLALQRFVRHMAFLYTAVQRAAIVQQRNSLPTSCLGCSAVLICYEHCVLQHYDPFYPTTLGGLDRCQNNFVLYSTRMLLSFNFTRDREDPTSNASVTNSTWNRTVCRRFLRPSHIAWGKTGRKRRRKRRTEKGTPTISWRYRTSCAVHVSCCSNSRFAPPFFGSM